MRYNVLLSRAVGRDPLLFCSVDSQALPSNCWIMAGQICLKCSLVIGKWGFRAKISTSWLAEKHTWLDWKGKTRGWVGGSSNQPVCSLQQPCHASSQTFHLSLTCAQSRLIPPVSWLQPSSGRPAAFSELPVMLRLFLLWECVAPSCPTPSWWSNSSKSKQRNDFVMMLCTRAD